MMDEKQNKEILEEFKNKHLDNYKNAVCEVIKNNTNSLIYDDISSLLKEPPLDSMDLLKSKLISLAKKKKVILKTDDLKKILYTYRSLVLDFLVSLCDIRNEKLISKVKKFSPNRESEIIIIDISDFDSLDKKIKQQVKKNINMNACNYLLDNINSIFKDDSNELEITEIKDHFLKYIKGSFVKNLLESISIKLMVKNRTLINGVAEQGERYLFTKNNSYILNDKKKSKLQ